MQKMSACVVINLTVYFLLNSKSSSANGKGALYQIQQWGRKKTRVEKPCNMTVAMKETDIQSRIHIWNCFLPTSKHAEGALNLSSGYKTTYQSILRMLLSIYYQKSEQWHKEEFSLLPGRQLLSLGCKQYLCSSDLLLD